MLFRSGLNALLDATTAGNNTAVGVEALQNVTTGGDNIAMGRQSAEKITTGNSNTAIGFRNSCNLTTGSNNIALGNNAGTDAVRNLTGSCANNIVIGNDANTNAYIKIDWTVTSDLRDKTEIKNVTHGLDFVNQITPIEYRFKKSREDDTPHGYKKYGFKAQEILELEGDNPVIINNEDTDNLKLTNSHLIPVLVNAIKELKAEIELLKNK